MKKKMIIVIVALLVAFCIGGFLFYYFSPNQRVGRLITQAESYVANGDNNLAEAAYMDALKINPASEEAFSGLVSVYDQSDNVESLVSMASMAGTDQAKDILRDSWNQKLNELIESNEYDKALSVIGSVENVDNVAVDTNSIRRELSDKVCGAALSSEDAVGTYNRAIDIDPKNENAYGLLVDYYLTEKQYDEALQTIRSAVSATGNEDALGNKIQSIPYVLVNDVKQDNYTTVTDDLIVDLVDPTTKESLPGVEASASPLESDIAYVVQDYAQLENYDYITVYITSVADVSFKIPEETFMKAQSTGMTVTMLQPFPRLFDYYTGEEFHTDIENPSVFSDVTKVWDGQEYKIYTSAECKDLNDKYDVSPTNDGKVEIKTTYAKRLIYRILTPKNYGGIVLATSSSDNEANYQIEADTSGNDMSTYGKLEDTTYRFLNAGDPGDRTEEYLEDMDQAKEGVYGQVKSDKQAQAIWGTPTIRVFSKELGVHHYLPEIPDMSVFYTGTTAVSVFLMDDNTGYKYFMYSLTKSSEKQHFTDFKFRIGEKDGEYYYIAFKSNPSEKEAEILEKYKDKMALTAWLE